MSHHRRSSSSVAHIEMILSDEQDSSSLHPIKLWTDLLILWSDRWASATSTASHKSGQSNQVTYRQIPICLYSVSV